jgi:phosphoenolpyruvate carboxykinase (GTP)
MMDRLQGTVGGVVSPVGTLPKLGDMDLHGLEMDATVAQAILSVDAADIESDAVDAQTLLTEIGATVPSAIWAENAETIGLCH